MDDLTFDALVERARSLVTGDRRVVLGISGSPGAGKTTLAERLVEALAARPPEGLDPGGWVAHVPMDGFHLADVQLTRLGNLDRKGAPDTFDAAGYAALVRRLVSEPDRPDEVVYAPGFERVLEQPLAGAIAVHPSVRLVVSEGNYLLLDDDRWRPVREAMAEVWYCDTSEDRRLHQLVARHAEFGKSPGDARHWSFGPDQANADLVRPTRDRADLVVPDHVLRAVPPT
ncbi:nucleoside/nucleotide kinase family protein [Solicola sp. PLA-1-18]|uniref:nucleoside/nucleotide kinase family protein n=1 Tax=Solicola sp. PLA-1-18 TaxID=3380532 RepID=UPI003B7A6E74